MLARSGCDELIRPAVALSARAAGNTFCTLNFEKNSNVCCTIVQNNSGTTLTATTQFISVSEINAKPNLPSFSNSSTEKEFWSEPHQLERR